MFRFKQPSSGSLPFVQSKNGTGTGYMHTLELEI